MSFRSLALAWVVLAFAARAAEPGPPAELGAAIQRQVAEREAQQHQFLEAQAALQKWYHSALDALKKNAMTKGDLESVLAVDTERERVERDLSAEERSKLPPLQRTVRDQYDQARLKQSGLQKNAADASLHAYLGTLELMEKRMTQKLDIEGAVAVRRERAAAAELLNGASALAVPPAPAPPPVAAATPPARPPGTPAPLAPTGTPGHHVTFFVNVDGTDDLIIQKGVLHLEHRRDAKPGNMKINEANWDPKWTANRSDDYSKFAPALVPFSSTPVVVQNIKGRSQVTVTQQPEEANDWTLIVRLFDPNNGTADLEFLVRW